MGRERTSLPVSPSGLIGTSPDPTSGAESASDENVVSCTVRIAETEVEEEEGVPGVRFSTRAPCSLCLGVLRSRSAESLPISSAFLVKMFITGVNMLTLR